MESDKTIIDNYLQNLLSNKERTDFENSMHDNPELKKEVENMRALQYGIIAAGNKKLKQDLQRMHKETFEGLKPILSPEAAKAKKIRMAGFALAAVFVLGILGWLFLPKQDAASLFDENYAPFQIDLVDQKNPEDKLLARIQQLYQSKNFRATMPLADEYINDHPDNTKLKLISGICALEMENYEEAVAKFSAITNPIYEDRASWYIALIYLKNDDLLNAKTALQKVRAFADSPFNKKANTLLENIAKLE